MRPVNRQRRSGSPRADLAPLGHSEDGGCQELLLNVLRGSDSRSNRSRAARCPSLARRAGPSLLCFVGHTDVVLRVRSKVAQRPFVPPSAMGSSSARAADMKPRLRFRRAVEVSSPGMLRLGIDRLLITSRGGPAVHGTSKVIELLKSRANASTLPGRRADMRSRLGDTIKNGARPLPEH